MPQLNPDPWFFILVFSWTILLTLAPKKILSHNILNNPSTPSTKTHHQNWIWPWS
uniref:ATP synthase complex subunit 8 n=1 Tax=Dyscophus antongilii TaxID=272187 RepID=S4UZY1_9NEOB|nr:ATP synthase F0 subunit 8 [Dyscophus antongilii]